MDTIKNKTRLFRIIQIGSRSDIPSTLFDIFISIVILASVSVTFLQTFEELRSLRILHYIEFASICIFITEYALRLYTSDLLYPTLPPAKALVKFIFSFYGLIDLLTIVSYFIPVIFTSGIVALRMIRVIRICRLFSLTNNYDAFDIIFDVLYDKRYQILSSVVIISLLMMMSSMLMYSIEHEAQPEAFANAFSGLWWAVSTILTVGYGDIYPITALGKIMAIVIAFLGVGLVAMPTGIISAGFVEHYHNSTHHSETILKTVPAPAMTDQQLSAIEKALLRKQSPAPLICGCCPLCKTKLDSIKADYCPVCGQRILD